MRLKSAGKISPLFFVTIITALALIGCDTADGTSLSSEAAILAYATDYLAEAPVIDVPNRTVTVTVQPMDLSGFDPEITLSDHASLTPPSAIEDGVPAPYTVTAENGSTAVWTVTVNVQYGISYYLGSTRIVHTCGMIDSTNEHLNTLLENGIPRMVPGGSQEDNYAYIFETPIEFQQFNPGSTIGCDYTYFSIYENTPGASSGILEYSDYSESTDAVFDLASTVIEFGSSREDAIVLFSGDETMDRAIGGVELQKVTGGFAKLKVIPEFY